MVPDAQPSPSALTHAPQCCRTQRPGGNSRKANLEDHPALPMTQAPSGEDWKRGDPQRRLPQGSAATAENASSNPECGHATQREAMSLFRGWALIRGAVGSRGK